MKWDHITLWFLHTISIPILVVYNINDKELKRDRHTERESRCPYRLGIEDENLHAGDVLQHAPDVISSGRCQRHLRIWEYLRLLGFGLGFLIFFFLLFLLFLLLLRRVCVRSVAGSSRTKYLNVSEERNRHQTTKARLNVCMYVCFECCVSDKIRTPKN